MSDRKNTSNILTTDIAEANFKRATLISVSISRLFFFFFRGVCLLLERLVLHRDCDGNIVAADKFTDGPFFVAFADEFDFRD